MVFIEYLSIDGTFEKSCIQQDSVCVVLMQCNSCEINQGARVNYEFHQVNTFSECIIANVTTTSSIPGEISSIQQAISSIEEQLFRGFDPSQFFFEMTPSVTSRQVFITDSYEWKTDVTGYHVSVVSKAKEGSMSTVYE